MKGDAGLIERFVATFVRLDDVTHFGDEPPPAELSAGIDPENSYYVRWRPAAISTPADALSAIHKHTGGILPDLYEQLALSYRWMEVDLGVCRLLENLPAAGLQPLADSMFADPVLNNTLIPARFARFAKAPFENYNPICFDLNRYANGDCPIVRFDHESILCHDVLGDAKQVFDSFRDLMVAVLNLADEL